jgi:hypothetical protein
MADDWRQLSRAAQFLIVEGKAGSGSPPTYAGDWLPVWDARVDRIEENGGARSSTAVITLAGMRWEADHGLRFGDRIRITTAEQAPSERTCIFSGFVTQQYSKFAGGDGDNGGEENRIVCKDHRWLLGKSTLMVGQIVRGPDDYTDYAQAAEAPIKGSYTWASGRRMIFNEDGRGNRDGTELKYYYKEGSYVETPIFAARRTGAQPWTVRQMLSHIINIHNTIRPYFAIDDPAATLILMDHEDLDRVLSHVVVEGIDVLHAIEHILSQIAWGFREDYIYDGTAWLTLYKVNSAVGYTHDLDNPVILHKLHAPAAGETISTAVAEGRKMLWAAEITEDIGDVVNAPRGLGSPDRFEFTAELVPAWLDSDLSPDTDNLYFSEADLQEEENPNGYDYYKYYHVRGSSFRRDVGRKWALNESGLYSAGAYDRGMPFDFATVVPAQFIKNSDGKRLFAPFNRRLLPCLTIDKDTRNSVGIRVEFSFDGGSTWQVIPASIRGIEEEAGIYIDEPNLAEMADQAEGTISGGALDGEYLNVWTSLADDKLNARSYKEGEWSTRVRVTASVQMDLRLTKSVSPSSAGGSPFFHRDIFDYSGKYGIRQRTSSSIFDSGDLSSDDADESAWFEAHLEAIREANEDVAISGQYTLDRLWPGEFACGDSVETLTGRDYDLAVNYGDRIIYPEIVQIVYLPDRQKMTLITRDLRFAQVHQVG